MQRRELPDVYGSGHSTSFDVSAGAEDVATFYIAAMKEKGWIYQGTIDDKLNFTQSNPGCHKEGLLADVSIKPSGANHVSVSLFVMLGRRFINYGN